MALIGNVRLTQKVVKIKRTSSVGLEIVAGDEVYRHSALDTATIGVCSSEASSGLIIEALASQGYQIASQVARTVTDLGGFHMQLGEILMQQVDANAPEDPGVTAAFRLQLHSKAGVIKDGSACFIATACYGNSAHPDVVLFRSWRDKVLLPSKAGQHFVAFYYTVAPLVAALLEQMPHFAAMARRFALAPLARKLRKQSVAENKQEPQPSPAPYGSPAAGSPSGEA